MARLPFVGPSFGLSSKAAGAQESANIFPCAIDDPNERGKNLAYMRGCPGYHLAWTLPTTPIRGLWSGGGRLFAVAGNHLYELALHTYPGTPGGGNYLNDWDMGEGDGKPVQMFGNGNQLLIIANGKAYIHNGGSYGPQVCRFALNGTFTTADGFNLVWVSGDKFTADMVGQAGTFNGAALMVDAFTDDQHIHLAYTVGIQSTPVQYNAPGGEVVTAVTGAYLDSSFYVQRPVTDGQPNLGRQVNFSAVNDGTSWSGLDFFSKEAYPDHIQSILADHEQLYVFGFESGEIWQNDLQTGRPVRIPSAAARIGSVARFAPVSLAGTVFFLGGPPNGQCIAYMMDGFTPRRISTHAEESAWAAAAADPSTAFCYPSIEEGHEFWVINFTTGTWVYDATESAKLGLPCWHQRYHYNPVGAGAWEPYKLRYHAFVPEWGTSGMHFAGEYATGKIHQVSHEFYDEDGAATAWRRAIPARYNGGKQIFCGRMTLEMDTSHTEGSTNGPIVIRDYSDDRGETFHNPQQADLGGGTNGNAAFRVYWKQGGRSRHRVWRFTSVGMSKVALIDLDAEETAGLV